MKFTTNAMLAVFACALFFFFPSSSAFAQTQISGQVVDASGGDGLPSASVYMEASQRGALTMLDGSFDFTSLLTGEQVLVVNFVGYEAQKITLDLMGGSLVVPVIKLESSTFGLAEAKVMASAVSGRETPVAVSTLDVEYIERNLGDKELVEVLNITPGVYATKSSGGYGDSRINIRGFNQRQIAVMINGIPVNDMENKWVYWSNWSGLGDAVQSIQVQRGLGASKLAVPSVGGTLNIITKTTGAKRRIVYETNVTDWGRYRNTLSYSTGVLPSGWAMSLVGSRTVSDGYADGNFINAWSYYGSASKDFGDHRMVVTAIGAPQKHGQRRSNMAIWQYDTLTARGHDAYKWNMNWGDRDGEMFNSKVNSYHKPQISISDYWQINETTRMQNSAYVSVGIGYGTGQSGLSRGGSGEFDPIDWNEVIRINQEYDNISTYGEDEIGYNESLGAWVDTLHHQGDVVMFEGDTARGAARNYIYASHNSHFWTGVISSIVSELRPGLTFTGGFDGRYYEGTHTRTVEDLLGAPYMDYSFGAAPGGYATLPVVGDKYYYHNIGQVVYGGLFSQLELNADWGTAFVSAAASLTRYRRFDPYENFRYDESGIQPVTTYPGGGDSAAVVTDEYISGVNSPVVTNPGFNVKAGVSRNLGDHHTVFVNGGFNSIVPDFKFAWNGFTNVPNQDLVNERITSMEFGYRFSHLRHSFNFNLYHTVWADKTITTSARDYDQDGIAEQAFILGLIETHDGMEFEWRTRPNNWLSVGGMMSFGNWRWDNDVKAAVYYLDGTLADSLQIYSAGLKVSDAPQSQFGLLADAQLDNGLEIGVSYIFNDKLYAKFDPAIDRTHLHPERVGFQPVLLPSFGYVDARIRYKFDPIDDWGGARITLSLNVQNVTDNHYISDGFEEWRKEQIYDPVTWELIEETNYQGTVENGYLEGWYAYGRTISLSVKMTI